MLAWLASTLALSAAATEADLADSVTDPSQGYVREKRAPPTWWFLLWE